MRVSVIVPTYNRAELVCQAVDSILQQKEQADEILVVDDGSTDDTLARLKFYGDAIRVISKTNGGVVSARNAGIKAANFEWLTFLDSDDLWKPNKLQRQKIELRANPDYHICYSDEEWRKNDRWVNPPKGIKKYGGWIYERCLSRCFISASSVLVQRCVFDQIGLFDESLPACEDYDLWLRIACFFPFLYIPEKLIIKRDGAWPQLSHQHSLDKYRIQALLKMLDSDFSDATNVRATRDMLLKKCKIYAAGCRKHNRPDEAAWALNISRQIGVEK